MILFGFHHHHNLHHNHQHYDNPESQCHYNLHNRRAVADCDSVFFIIDIRTVSIMMIITLAKLMIITWRTVMLMNDDDDNDSDWSKINYYHHYHNRYRITLRIVIRQLQYYSSVSGPKSGYFRESRKYNIFWIKFDFSFWLPCALENKYTDLGIWLRHVHNKLIFMNTPIKQLHVYWYTYTHIYAYISVCVHICVNISLFYPSL